MEPPLTEYATDLLDFEYPNWINIVSITEFEIYDEPEAEDKVYELHIEFEDNGYIIKDIWIYDPVEGDNGFEYNLWLYSFII